MNKKYLEISEQIELFRSRGMIVEIKKKPQKNWFL